MEPLRIAVVGCGAVAQLQYLPALAASRAARAVALVDRDLPRAHALAERWGVPHAVADVAELADGVDAAIVALPNHLHAPVAIALLRRGVQVLVEKPMATTVAECDAMIAAAAESGATLAVGLQFRFFDSTAAVGDLLAAELVGPLTRFELRQGVIPRWPFASDYLLRRETAGGGVLADYGVHVLDLLLCWLGEWASVDYRDDAMGGIEADCELELTFAAGLAGTVEVSRSRNLRNRCRFPGRAGARGGGLGPRPRGGAASAGQGRRSRRARPARRRGARLRRTPSCGSSTTSPRRCARDASRGCPAARAGAAWR